MRTRLLPLLALALTSPCWAISVSGVGAFGSGTDPSGAMSASVSAGTGIAVVVSEGNAGGCSTPTVSDTLNGTYAALKTYNGSNVVGVYWIVATTTGTPTISVSTSGCYAKFFANQVSGFTGTPTVDAALASHVNGTSATVAVNATTNFANEVMFVSWADTGGNNGTSGATGWTASYGCAAAYGCSGGFGAAYAVEATATANNYSATLGASDTWDVVLAGIYDNTGAAPGVNNAVMPARGIAIGFGYPGGGGGGGLVLNGSPSAPVIGSAYSASLTPSGGSGNYACSQVSATPNTYQWLSITPGCTLQGIPEYAETDTVTEQVTDLTTSQTATKTFSIAPATSGSLAVVSSTSLANVTNNGAFAYHLLLKGGSGTYNCNNAYNTQPVAITPDCWILGTPTATGAISLGTVTAYDAQTGASVTWSPSLTVDSTLRLAGVDPDTSQINLPPAISGNYWSARVIGYGGSGSLTYSITAGKPSWMTATSTSNGLVMTGTPMSSGNVSMAVKVTDTSSDTATSPALINISSGSVVSRPAYNTGSGFFVLNQNLYDPNGHLFVMDGFDRNHFNSADWTGGMNGALSGANAVREFFGFGLVDQGENQTPAQMVSQITNEYVNNGIVPIVTVWTIPTSFTGSISGTTLTVTAVNSTVSTANGGILSSGYNYATGGLIGSGIAGNTYISSQLTGTGGHACPDVTCNGTTGTYQVSVSQTVGSESMEENAGTSSGYDANQIVGAANMIASAYASELSTVQNDILINIANEWGGSPQCSGSYSYFVSTYETAISTLRTAGYTSPLVIDLPCEGEDTSGFFSGGYAASIIASDPLKNVIFSAHLYNTTSTIGQVSGISKATDGVITINSTAASNPWSLLTNFNGTVCLSGVQGMTQINGQCPTVTSFGGSSGAWTLTTSLNTSSYGTYTSGGVVTDGYYYQNRVNVLAALASSGMPVMVGEYGPPGSPAMCGSQIDNQSVGISTLSASLRAAGISQLYWAWDDNDAAGDQTYWSCYFGMTGPLNTSYTAGQYAPTVPSSLTYPGIDVVTNPRTGLLSGAVPATVLH